jgi:hypothetical protein
MHLLQIRELTLAIPRSNYSTDMNVKNKKKSVKHFFHIISFLEVGVRG